VRLTFLFVDPIALPPLRKRPGGIPLLVESAVESAAIGANGHRIAESYGMESTPDVEPGPASLCSMERSNYDH
jgi:hypothetical protein